MEKSGEDFLQKPDPPVVGKVSHQSIELYWDINSTLQRKGSTHDWLKFSIEEEDAKTHVYGTIYSFMLTCFAGHLDIVQYLRKQGASWECRDKGGCTAMHWAVDGGHLKVIQWLIDDGCKIDIKDTCLAWTPLMRVSAITGNTNVALCLIEAGADVNTKDADGKTPLMVATLNNHESLVRLLIEKGANCDIKTEYGITIPDMAKAFNRQNVLLIFEEMKRESL
ncbi:hypothetical protein FKM82_014588 [Ascaphus truei]